MKRKAFISIGLAVIALAIVIAVVYAFGFGNVDGVWGVINNGGGASNEKWATGPAGVDGATFNLDNETRYSSNWWDQTSWQTGWLIPVNHYNNTDWNQVRYGSSSFNSSSGMAFDGVNEVSPHLDFGYEQPFVLGRFCHINNSITASTYLETVPLTVTVSDIACGSDALPGGPYIPGTEPPTPITSMAFTYTFGLDETTNSLNPCPYLPGDPVNDYGCADAISISQAPADQKFRSLFESDIYVDYTVGVLGFMEMNANGTCPVWDAGQSIGQYISKEGTTNCTCLYGSITDYTPTAVDLVYFTAEVSEEGTLLAWQTANEVDNIGFNLYRAESKTGSKVKLNETLIPTNVMPGSLVGAFYSYEDTTAKGGLTYYYWLEDVEAGGKATLHGPVEMQ
ncbi:MAG: hypothetical protein GX825_06405 [Syntrophomonadaceae bacterium]|nr:hypothetical protein [Syntrophomonadaceae bacterium]